MADSPQLRWNRRNCSKIRRYKLKYKYGLTPEQVEDMHAEQGGLCGNPGCGEVAEVIDHNHATGRVRSLLCKSCNLSLGLLKENASRINGLAEYITLNSGLPGIGEALLWP